MDRRFTNKIRYFLDEWLPPVIRDNRFFMFPLFFLWFRGRNVHRFMEFKSHFHKMTEEEMTQLYDDLKEQFKVRESDLLPECRDLMLEWTDPACRTLLDVGCGRGHLLKAYAKQGYEVMGCDLVNPSSTVVVTKKSAQMP